VQVVEAANLAGIMAIFKDPNYLRQNDDTAFDKDHAPGQIPPRSGIYRCMGCGREIVAEERRQFPPQNHHEHVPSQGSVRWRMIVYADHSVK
jgi:hypothetical protein